MAKQTNVNPGPPFFGFKHRKLGDPEIPVLPDVNTSGREPDECFLVDDFKLSSCENFQKQSQYSLHSLAALNIEQY
jgi:hypothetical protein